MKILFMDYSHLPLPDANGNCIEKLRKTLIKKNVQSDVLSFRLDRKIPRVTRDQYGVIYTADTWMRLSFTGRSTGESLARIIVRSSIAIPLKIVHALCGGQYAKDEVFTPFECALYKQKLEYLCRTQKYDWVVAVSNPYCIHRIGATSDLSGARLALYYLDPHSFNSMLSPKTLQHRLNEEIKVCAKADLIFAALEHREDWNTSALSMFLNKTNFIPYPNLSPFEGERACATIKKMTDILDVVYLGALNDEFRQPKAMLELFEKMQVYASNFRLIIVGSRCGTQVSEQLNKAKSILKDRLIISPPVPFPQAMDLLRRSDAVINLGNKMKNQMPSKLLDYIAAGKPIINISPNRPCNTHPYIARYPLAVQFYNDELVDAAGLEAAAEKVVDFVVENRGKSLSWAEVESTMSGFTSADVAKKMLHAMESAKK